MIEESKEEVKESVEKGEGADGRNKGEGVVLPAGEATIDNFVGKYKSANDLKIGDRDITQLIEVSEKNNKKYLNLKKFEIQCKKHSVEEKSRLVLIWCRKIMGLWEKSLLEGMGEAWLKTSEGKMELGKHQQCYRNIKPLYKQLKKGSLNQTILDSLYLIVQFCMMKEYVKAHDKYMELAIGNSPWPMGVTMVGIHERSGRSRIFTS